MKPEQLHVVTCVSNHLRWVSRVRLYRDFEKHILDSGCRLTTVWCDFGERAPEWDNPHVQNVHVGADAGAVVWNKESLLNLGIQRTTCRYLLTADADVRWRSSHWATETLQALQQYRVVQPWEHCYDLGPNGEHLSTHRSFGSMVAKGMPIVQGPNARVGGYEFGHPGYAWAWNRQVLEWTGGLNETAGLGAADHHMAMAMIGRVRESIPGNIGEAYTNPLLLWQRRVTQHLGESVGFIPGTIEHAWHGSKAKRAYVERWKILIDNKFDPAVDTKRNTYGVLELAGNKPRLRREMDMYFRRRVEDANMMDD